MDKNNFKTDLTFFTNEPNANLLDRFVQTLKDVKYFDILVGYFRSSGFFRLYKSFENIEKIRILVGLNLDRKSFQIIEKANNIFETHAKVKEIVAIKLKLKLILLKISTLKYISVAIMKKTVIMEM